MIASPGRFTWAALAAVLSLPPAYSQTFLTTESLLSTPPFGESHLRRFDAETQSLATNSGAGATYQGVAVLGNELLVADFGEGAIQRFARDGTLLAPFANIASPAFLESDAAGSVYTTPFSLGPAEATRFDSAGNVSGTYASASAPGFAGIDADAAGNVYIATQSNTIEKYAADGTFLGSTAVSAVPLDMTIDEQGSRLFLALETPAPEGIHVFNLGDELPVFSHAIPLPTESSIQGLHYSSALDALFAVDSGLVGDDPRGMRLAMDGSLLATYRPTGSVATAFDVVHFIPEPSALALAALGAVACWLRFFRLASSRRAAPHS